MSQKRPRFDAGEWKNHLRLAEARVTSQIDHEWLQLSPNTPFHAWLSCITSQRISFTASRAVRSYIYSLHEEGNTSFTLERMGRMSAFEWARCRSLGLTVQQLDVAQRFVAYCQAYLPASESESESALSTHLAQEIEVVQQALRPGIGPWTCKAVQLSLAYASPSSHDLFLGEDFHVRTQLQCMLPIATPTLTIAQANQLGSQFAHPGTMAMILWRARKPAWATWLASSSATTLARQDFF